MSFNNFVKSVLDPIGVPVFYITYTGTASQYIVFNEWNIPALHADDQEKQTDYTVQVDVFSTGNFISLVDQVKDRMTAAGFIRILEESEYIEEKKIFRKILRFRYVKEVE